MQDMEETNKANLKMFLILQSNISVRCTFPGFQSAFCYKYFAALPLLVKNEWYGRNKKGDFILLPWHHPENPK